MKKNLDRLNMHRVSASLILILLTTGMCDLARATDLALLQVLRNNKLITDSQFQALAEAAKSALPAELPVPQADQDVLDVLLANKLITPAQFAALRIKTGQEKRNDPEAKTALKDGLKVKTQDGTFQAQIGTYFQVDAASYGDDKTDFSTGTELRRGRISVAGTLFTDWDYKLEADFAGTTQGGATNTVTVTDAYTRYNGFRPFALTVGSFKVPFGLEAVGSAKYQTFNERGLPFAFLTLRRLGAMVADNGDNWTASVGAFGDTVTSQNGDDEGTQVAGRVTYAPFYTGDRVLHFGLSSSWVAPAQNPKTVNNGIETIQFRAKPESNLISDGLIPSAALTAAGQTFGRSSGRLVDTGNITGGISGFLLTGAEFAGVYGPFSVQGEYIRTDVDRDLGGNLSFDGYYAYASWFLTGESRVYRGDKGVFDAFAPRNPFNLTYGGWGAWELAARFSALDLNDRKVAGGYLEDATFGLNWYPNAYVRVMANYINVLKVAGGAHSGDNPDVFQLRFQFAY